MNDLPPGDARRRDDLPAPGARNLRDVAPLAGVSIGAASKALNANAGLT